MAPQPMAPQPMAPAPALRLRPSVPAAQPARADIPSSVVGPDLVVRKGATVSVPAAADESSIATSEAQMAAMPQGPMPVVVRKVPRPIDDERDLPPTEAWTPKRDQEQPVRPRPAAGAPAPLYDDSYKLFRSDELDGQQAPPPPDRSMDLIWWSLAIAGALVLIALLITFR